MSISLLLLVTTVCFGCAQLDSTTALPADLSQEQFVQKMAAPNPPLLLDVRSQAEFDAGHIAGAVLVPHDQLKARLPELEWSKQQPIVIYCRTGRRSELARKTLHEAGFTSLAHLVGDWNGWKEAGRPIEVAKPAAAQTD